MRFKELLKGKDSKAQERLDNFFSSVIEERILWYPSAGLDFRDLLEMSPERRTLHHIDETPTIICHTDYDSRLLNDKYTYSDQWTQVNLLDKTPLETVPEADVRYLVNPDYVSCADFALQYPKIYLLDLEIESHVLGKFQRSVFYFLFENYNFLKEILLKNKLTVSHFVKVREGCAFGGCRQSISVFYSLLGELNVEFLLVDDEISYSKKIHDKIARRFNINHTKYEIEKLNDITKWSGLPVKVFKVAHNDELMTAEDLSAILKQISGQNTIYYNDTHQR